MKYRKNQTVTLWGQWIGKVLKVHKQENGEYRYRCKWNHPSESRPQIGWFDETEIEA